MTFPTKSQVVDALYYYRRWARDTRGLTLWTANCYVKHIRHMLATTTSFTEDVIEKRLRGLERHPRRVVDVRRHL